MSTQGTIKRYTLLIEKISFGGYPTFKELKEFLEDHGFSVSPRTLQRQIEQIRNEFGIEILYDRSKNGYFIDSEQSINMDSFIKFLEIVGTGEILTESLKEGKEILDFISFESEGSLKGIEHLRSLVLAIKNKRKLSFIHENFKNGFKKPYVVCPYHLKEYQSRWYLFGTIDDKNTFRTFGLDRLSELKTLPAKFKPITKPDPVRLFDDVVGLTYSASKIEEVELWLSSQQAPYIKTLPLHHSQTILKEDKQGMTIRLKVRLNFELTQKILSLGPNAKVLKPKVLVDEIADTIEEMKDLYSS